MNKLDWLKKQGFIIRLQGNDYVLYKGLVALAHEMGLKSIISEPIEIDWDAGRFIFKATVTMLDELGHEKVFVDYGDCTKHNTNKMIYPAALRMASTRARGRALRDATGVALTTHEELPN
jgi:isopentenyl phosphate kinase